MKLISLALLTVLLTGPAAAADPKRACVADPLIKQEHSSYEGKHFTVQIEGPTGPAIHNVILVPGLASPQEVWAATLQAQKQCRRVHVVQIRGFGDAAGANSDGPLLEPFVDELSEYIADKIIAKGGNRPAIVGHSLGGLSALMIASRRSELVGRLVIVDALPFIGPIFGTSTVEAIRSQAAAMAASIRAQPPAKGAPEDADPGPYSQAGFLSKSVSGRTAVARWTRLADPRVTAQALFDDMVTDVRPELGKISAPLTVLYAEDASVMPVGRADALYAAEYSGVPKARLVKISDSRHFIMLDQPEKFQAALEAILAE